MPELLNLFQSISFLIFIPHGYEPKLLDLAIYPIKLFFFFDNKVLISLQMSICSNNSRGWARIEPMTWVDRGYTLNHLGYPTLLRWSCFHTTGTWKRSQFLLLACFNCRLTGLIAFWYVFLSTLLNLTNKQSIYFEVYWVKKSFLLLDCNSKDPWPTKHFVQSSEFRMT